MSLGQVVLLVFAMLMIVGGMLGARAGSQISLIAGSASCLVLLAALLVSLWNPAAGFWTGSAVGLVLCGVFGARWVQTRKMMPSGMLLIISVVALLLLVWAARQAGAEASAPAVEVAPANASLAASGEVV